MSLRNRFDNAQEWEETARSLDRELTRVRGLLEEAVQQIEYEAGERDAPPYEASLSSVASGLRDRLMTGGQPNITRTSWS